MIQHEPAIRVDPGSGTEEQAAFHGVAGARLLGVTHLPAGQAVGGVVICSPIKAEFMKNYRREVLLARELAARGVAVQRFHYRGTGNSDGDGAHLTFDTMRDDAGAALDVLGGATDVTRVAFLGTRVGALVAAAVARAHGEGPVALWAPVVDAQRYFREVNRARLIRALRQGTTDRSGIDEEIDQLGRADVVGFSVDRPLYDSLIGLTLAAELGEHPRPLFIAQLLPRTNLSAENQRLAEQLESAGWAIAIHTIEADITWWFQENDASQADVAGDLIGITADWVVGQLTGGVT